MKNQKRKPSGKVKYTEKKGDSPERRAYYNNK